MENQNWYNNDFNAIAFGVWIVSAIIFLAIRKLPIFVNSVGAIYPIIVIAAILYYLANKMFNKTEQI